MSQGLTAPLDSFVLREKGKFHESKMTLWKWLRDKTLNGHTYYVRLYSISNLLSVSPYVSSFVQYLSYHLNVSLYVSSFVHHLSYLLSVSPYVSSFVQY